MKVAVASAIRGLVVSAVVLALSICSPQPAGSSDRAEGAIVAIKHAAPATMPLAVVLPTKTFTIFANHAIRATGHWVLRTSDPPLAADGFPFGAAQLNSTIVECSPSAGTCLEYRAQVLGGVLLPLEPLSFLLVPSEGDQVLAQWTAPGAVECLLRIDKGRGEVEMVYRRQASEDRRRIFERWVLE